MNATLFRGVLVGALAGLLFGFDTAVIAGTTEGIRTAFGLDAAGVGITVSSALWGTLAGALLAGVPGDRYGARTSLQVIALITLAGLGYRLLRRVELGIAARLPRARRVRGRRIVRPRPRLHRRDCAGRKARHDGRGVPA